ncbi:exoribonuclease-2 [Paucidesulfovibrio gracilis DSM 16080]|uniref:Exoribonuclease-2 n=1 Tax=Paucidesulfovibrio gracilis DSM 16080 TaxID=1121449 RepID=A0A1T4XZV3_9BACT|nr:ribonuclease catalytic domain-containing protein [Paucidesulfovibrio gracilis]SKA95060.1 exoribonuclease-2 [Paucidesulfovibrio gracilis DSM 16080]
MVKLRPETFPGPGCVVEFMQGNQPQLAWVQEENSGKLRALTVNKREVKLACARLLPWIGPQNNPDASRQEILEQLEKHHQRRGSIQAGLDVMEVWELAQGELEEAPLKWFADLVFDDPSPDEMAALGRALLAAKTHFKFRPPMFEIHPADKVDQRLRQEAEERVRDRITAVGQELFKSLWTAQREPSGLELPEEVAEGLRALLLDQISGTADEKADKLWAGLRKGLPEHPHQALVLARAWGIVEPHHNHLLDEAGYTMDDSWSAALADEVRELRETVAVHAATPLDTPFVSIDSATTRDIDDAFFVERQGEGYRLSLALARPLGWRFGSALDRAVAQRATSLYLPEGTGHMLPHCLGLDAFSLMAGQTRPALVTEFLFGPGGALLSVTPSLEWVRVAANTPYEVAEEALDNHADPMLETALELAKLLFKQRLKAGASIIKRPDPEVTLSGDGVDVRVEVEVKQPTLKSSLTVSEFMILANSALADWAARHHVPLLHRTQNIALPSEAQGIFSAPEDIFRAVKYMAPPLLEAHPKRHAALAVDAYAPITSPIRRYTDLINSAQVAGYLDNATPPFSQEGLEALLPGLSSRIGQVSQIQRFRPRYWKLLYLAQNRKQRHSAVLVEENGPYPSLAMPKLQMNVRAPRALLGDKLYPGQRFQLKFGRVDPLTNTIKIAEALEE